MSILRKTRQLLTPPGALRTATRVASGSERTSELPWTVSWARSADEFAQALLLRTDAYGRHFGGSELAFDDHDLARNAFVLIAREKRSGALLGSMRVSFGVDAEVEMLQFHPEPGMLAGVKLGEARRLSLKPSRYAALVKLSIWKAFWLSCQAHEVRAMLIAARFPMNDDYRLLLFEEAVPGNSWFEPGSVPDPHELLIQWVDDIEERYRSHSAELHRFMFVLEHPDIATVPAGACNPLWGADKLRLLAQSVRAIGPGLEPVVSQG